MATQIQFTDGRIKFNDSKILTASSGGGLGACCYTDTHITNHDDCVSAGGIWQGNYSSGCLRCISTTKANCNDVKHGKFFGEGAVCPPANFCCFYLTGHITFCAAIPFTGVGGSPCCLIKVPPITIGFTVLIESPVGSPPVPACPFDRSKDSSPTSIYHALVIGTEIILLTFSPCSTGPPGFECSALPGLMSGANINFGNYFGGNGLHWDHTTNLWSVGLVLTLPLYSQFGGTTTFSGDPRGQTISLSSGGGNCSVNTGVAQTAGTIVFDPAT